LYSISSAAVKKLRDVICVTINEIPRHTGITAIRISGLLYRRHFCRSHISKH